MPFKFQVSRTLLSILSDLSNAVVGMVFTHSLFSKSSSPFNHFLVTVPRPPIIIALNITFMFHSVFHSLSRLRYFSLLSLSFNFPLWLAETTKFTVLQILFFCFLFFFIRSGHLAEIR